MFAVRSDTFPTCAPCSRTPPPPPLPDERKLRELLAKMREQVVEADPHASAGSEAAEKSHLMEIVGKYGMAKEDIAGACSSSRAAAAVQQELAAGTGNVRSSSPRSCVHVVVAYVVMWPAQPSSSGSMSTTTKSRDPPQALRDDLSVSVPVAHNPSVCVHVCCQCRACGVRA